MSSNVTGSTRMIEWLAWFEENKKAVLIGVGTVIVLIAALTIYRWSRNQAENKASAALFVVEKPATRGLETNGPGAQAYLEVARTYSGTGAGAQALLLAGEALFKEGKYAEAKAQFENFLRDYAGHSLAGAAAYGIAASLDAQEKTNDALAAYKEVVARYPNTAVSGQAKLALAGLYEARNDPAQALKIYEEFTRSAAPTMWSSTAARRREQLLLQHPDLARTNPPPAAAVLSAPSSNVMKLSPTNPPPAPPAQP